MSLNSKLTFFTLLLTAGATGCQGYQQTPFVAQYNLNTADFVQGDVGKQKRPKKYVSEKKPLYVELGFGDDEQSSVDERPLRRFPSQNRKLRIRRRNKSKNPSVATKQQEAPQHRLVGHTNQEPTRFVNLPATF